jgi:hypothetical protein
MELEWARLDLAQAQSGAFGLRAFGGAGAEMAQEKNPAHRGIGNERGKVQAVLGGGMSPRERSTDSGLL